MCGIFGWAARHSPDRPDARLARALERLQHRGPDGATTWTGQVGSHAVAFAHRRLAIIDIAGGRQPFFSHDGRFALCYNGEVYNYVELKAELLARGHAFTSDSDTEVVIEAWRAWGRDALPRLRGMFAFALADLQAGEVVLARDAFGKKPLFLTDLPDGGIAFSSEIAALIDADLIEARLDRSALANYLVARYVPGPGTLFQGVRKLNPGSCLLIGPQRTEAHRFFVPPFATVRPEPMGQAEADAAFAETLDEAVRLRMRSDAPFGAYLSGGLDSSVIVALMQRHSAHPTRTFSVGFDVPGASELTYAAAVARDLGTQHEEHEIGADSFFDLLPEATRLRGAPVSEPSDLPILALSRAAGRKVKMVLTGEGADELLSGYPKYKAEPLVGLSRSLLGGRVSQLAAPALRAMPLGRQRASVLARAVGEPDAMRRGELWFASLSHAEAAVLAGRELSPVILAELADMPPGSPARRLQLIDQLTWLPDNLLERGDRMMMGGSVEGRMPFMDVELAKLVARMPDRYLSGHPRGKAILRRYAQGLIDPRVIARPKVGFTVPIGAWLMNGHGEIIDDLLTSEASVTRRLLDPAGVDRIVEEFRSGRDRLVKKLWALLSLEVFLREYRLS